jgi:phosphoribosylamine--glycine ligase
VGNSLIATGGRVLSVVATASDFASARKLVYESIAKIQLEGSHYRSDIAAKVSD